MGSIIYCNTPHLLVENSVKIKYLGSWTAQNVCWWTFDPFSLVTDQIYMYICICVCMYVYIHIYTYMHFFLYWNTVDIQYYVSGVLHSDLTFVYIMKWSPWLI